MHLGLDAGVACEPGITVQIAGLALAALGVAIGIAVTGHLLTSISISALSS